MFTEHLEHPEYPTLVQFTRNEMCVTNNTHVYVARTSNDKASVVCDLYCCLLLQCEALHTCHSRFPIATSGCNRDVKVVPLPGATFTKRTCDQFGLLQNVTDVVATSKLVLFWMCDSPRTWFYAKSNTHIYVVRTSNNSLISTGDLCCCLLPHCETLCTCRSAFPSATQERCLLVIRMPSKWKWPEMSMYFDLNLNLATFDYPDGFGCYHFCSTGFGLKLMTFFWTSSQLSVQFWDCSLLYW